MILKSSQNNPFFQYILLLLLSGLLWGKTFHTEGLFHWQTWASWGICLGTAVGFGLTVQKHQLSRNPGIIAVIFLCLCSLHGGQEPDLPVWLYPVALLTLHCSLSIYGKAHSYPAIFNTGFLWGGICIFLPSLSLSLPCFFGILIAYSLNKWREWACALLGIGSAYLLLFAYFFLFHSRIPHWEWSQILPFGTTPWNPEFLLVYGTSGACIFFAFLSILSFRRYMQDLEISERHKSFSLAVMFFYFLIFYLITDIPLRSRFLLFFPTAFFCTKFLAKGKNTPLRETAFILIILLSLLQAYL